ncbi:hypothetical protein ABZ897_16050 [Nonomuraea sp. NPDC046802]|uniref:hypothetical protein n=1 Tax=Nonomuraea sp. NPDC046802 TaxID=3154919 RepID=UPI00340ACFF2
MSTIIRSRFHDLDLECLAKTAGQWAMGEDFDRDTSGRQKEAAERAYRLLIDPGPDQPEELPPPDDPNHTRVTVTFDAYIKMTRTITVSAPVPKTIASDPAAIEDYLIETETGWDELAEHNDDVESVTISDVRLGDQP